jgi:hypothetical protein
MRVFNASIEQLLWPEKRETDAYVKGLGRILRTTEESYLRVSTGSLPSFVSGVLSKFGKDELKIGPFPKGTPVNLLANLDMYAGEPMLSGLDSGRSDPAQARGTPRSSEIPKSRSFTSGSPSARVVRNRFAGLMSRCTIPAA